MSVSNKIKSILECDLEKIGFKTACYSCGAMFYDLNKTDPVCPLCNTPYSKSVKTIKKHIVTEFFADGELDVLADDSDEEEIFDDEDDAE